MIKFKIIVPILIITGLISCLEPFDFETTSYEQVLVVEGILTNETKSHIIRLSYTYPLDSGNSLSRISGAEVYIENSLGIKENFFDEGDGLYKSQLNFRGVQGETYKLVIITPENEQYESPFVELLASPAIDSIYSQYAELPSDETNVNEGGIQFFLDSHDPTGNVSYYRYDYEETYQIDVPYPSLYTFDGGVLAPRVESIGRCYKLDTSNSLLIGSSVNNAANIISEFPIRFIEQKQQQLRSRYSINVRQHAISESAYIYYRKSKENNESTGSLFDKQAGTIAGNISSIENPNKPVLGYFEVSGISNKRAFFDPQDFDEQFQRAPFNYSCRIEFATVYSVPELNVHFSDISSFSSQIGFIIFSNDPAAADSAYIFNKTCTSCDWYADTNAPDYWIE